MEQARKCGEWQARGVVGLPQGTQVAEGFAWSGRRLPFLHAPRFFNIAIVGPTTRYASNVADGCAGSAALALGEYHQTGHDSGQPDKKKPKPEQQPPVSVPH